MKNIFKFSFLFLIMFVCTATIYAEDADENIDPEPVLPPAEIPLDPIPDPVPELNPALQEESEQEPDPEEEPEEESGPEEEPNVTFIIRNGDSLLWSGTSPLPLLESERNVLAVLQDIDEGSEAFSITNIQEFSFGKYLKCILPTDATELCDNWQYAVGNSTPFTSIDNTMLVGGETIGIYFGTSHQLVLSSERINEGESLTATAQKYNYETNAWDILTGVSVGVTLPNPDDAWNPIVVSTHPVDDAGIANIAIAEENTYTLGIVEDYYFPSYTMVVEKAEENNENGAEDGGTSGSHPTAPSFRKADALSYLKSMQSEDGSFGDSDLYTDWAGVAFGAMKVSGTAKSQILSYFNSNNSKSSLLTDNERRAMALLSLGKNPYSFGDDEVNYIDAIIAEFDGTQFGDEDLVNDDIFALLPLSRAGYKASDEVISKTVDFILSNQNTNGSWVNSVDITSAAIQALQPFDSIASVSESLSSASDYLNNKQQDDGGWENSVFSTSWAMQAESALGASFEKNGKSGLDYLTDSQETDGAVSPESETDENRIWATSYALAGASGKSWTDIMQSVSKPRIEERGDEDTESSGTENRNEEVAVAEEEQSKDPITCPEGDLYSATTGERCTVFIVKNMNIESAGLAPSPAPSPASPTLTARTTPVEKTETVENPTEEKLAPSVPETLTATAIDALPAEQSQPKEKTSPTAPIVLGAFGGIALLYIVTKFLVK